MAALLVSASAFSAYTVHGPSQKVAFAYESDFGRTLRVFDLCGLAGHFHIVGLVEGHPKGRHNGSNNIRVAEDDASVSTGLQ